MIGLNQIKGKLIVLILSYNSVMAELKDERSNISTFINKSEIIENNDNDMNKTIVIYTFPILIIVGTICNILTFLVMRRKKLRNQSTGYYMAVLAVADELALLVGCLSGWLMSYKNFNILSISSYACKIFSVVLYTTFDFSVWLVVIMTIERFIAVTFPLKSMYFCTVKKAKVATLILTCILFAINSHFLITHSTVYDKNGTLGCDSANETFNYFIKHIWPWIDASKYAFVPFLTILIFNVLIIYNLFIAAKSIKNLSSNHQLQINHVTSNTQNLTNHGSTNSQSNSSNNRRLTVMLLVVSITFCILSTPVVVLQVLERAAPGPNYQTFYSICLCLQYINHSTNFFLYVVSGKLFRNEVIALFCGVLNIFKRVSKYKKPINNYNVKFSNINKPLKIGSKNNKKDTNGFFVLPNTYELQRSNHASSSADTDDAVETEPALI